VKNTPTYYNRDMRYCSVARRNFKIRKGLFKTGLVQDHHVIPRQFKEHPIVRKTGFDVNASENIIMMPTPVGKLVMRVRVDRLTHGYGHREYNAYVKRMLDCIVTKDELTQFRDHLKRCIRFYPHHVPW